jgi:MSHA pilin protein MshD
MRVSSKCRGFTLIETVLVIIIVGIAVAAIGTQFATNVGSSHEPLLRQRALAVANAYMDEILKKRWNSATPTGGGCVVTGSGSCTTPGAPAALAIGDDGQSRADFDDVDDYHGLDEAPTDSEGNAIPGYGNFNVTVEVGNPADATWNGIDRLDVLQIGVTVTTPTGESIALTAYRVNY